MLLYFLGTQKINIDQSYQEGNVNLRRCINGAAILALVLTGMPVFSAGQRATPARQGATPIVLASFTVLQDLTQIISGDLLDVRTITPVGGEVHEWELIPSNFRDLEDADLVLVNGLNLEEWMPQVLATVRTGVPVVEVADRSGFPTIPIRIGELTGSPDPHVWMNPEGAIAYLEVIAAELSQLVPEHQETFAANLSRGTAEIRATAEELQHRFATLPDSARTLITSEAAFLYFADFFGLDHDAIWGSNDEEEGTPGQIARVVDLIRAQGITVAFHESTISDRHVRAVAEETGIRVVGPLYVDSTGETGSTAETYLGMLRANTELIVRELLR